MFGYIKPDTPEMRVREFAAYRAVYCGLCRVMRRRYGRLFRLTLSYDFVYYAVVRALIRGGGFSFEMRRCFVHPTRKRAVALENDALRDGAAAAAILLYHKLLDDIADDRGLKRLARRMALPVARRARRIAVTDPAFAAADRDAEEALARLAALEKQNCQSPDPPAECFGTLLASLCAAGLDGADARIAREIGMHTGRWIYIADALDDLPGDLPHGKKPGSYNPFASSPPDGDEARCALNLECAALARAYALLSPDNDETPPGDEQPQSGTISPRELDAIAQNIIYLGMPKAAEAAPAHALKIQKTDTEGH